MSDDSPKLNDGFPDWYTIDEDGLSSLNYFLEKHYKDKTILITIVKVQS